MGIVQLLRIGFFEAWKAVRIVGQNQGKIAHCLAISPNNPYFST